MSSSFYVYQLIDPRDGLPFYVGKGTGGRAWQHQRDVERHVGLSNSRKVDRIRAILIAGHDVEIEILARYESEADALDHEWRLIDRSPTLTNMIAGGGGRNLTPEQIEKRRRAREERSRKIREREAAVRRRARVGRQVRAFVSDLNGERHREEIEAWVRDNERALDQRSVYPKEAAPKKKPPVQRVGLTEAKAHFEATGELKPGMPIGVKRRLIQWVKKRTPAAAA